jgi:hypothetical protein
MTAKKLVLALVACVLGVVFMLPVSAQQAQGRGAPAAAPGGLARPLRVYIRAGLKTHAVGQHDYPQFLADWSKIAMNSPTSMSSSCTRAMPAT